MTPRVTVLLPVRNGALYVGDAVRSLLGQSLRDIEILVLDDGSTDGSAAVATAFGDARVRVIASQAMGLARQLNRGLEEARGAFVARMDADDLAEPERLSCQVDFLEAHPHVALCGSWLRCFSDDCTYVARYPVSPATVRAYAIFDNPVAHPSVCWRAAAWRKSDLRYDEQADVAQDYDLWSRAVDVVQVDNVPAPLLRYRLHAESVTDQRAERSESRTRAIQAGWLARIGLPVDESVLAFHRVVGHGAGMRDPVELARAESWLMCVVEANRRAAVFESTALERAAGFVWLRVCLNSVRYGAFAASRHGASPLCRRHAPGVAERAQLWLGAAAARWRQPPAQRAGLRGRAA